MLDTKSNFLECMKDHYMNDEVVSPEDVREAELSINDHVRSWVKPLILVQTQEQVKLQGVIER